MVSALPNSPEAAAAQAARSIALQMLEERGRGAGLVGVARVDAALEHLLQGLDGRSSRDWFAEVVASELRPLLHEYWFDAPDVAEREADRLLEGW